MILAASVIFVYFMIFFVIATIIKNNSIVDIGWGLGFVITTWVLYVFYQPSSIIVVFVNIAVSLWGLRLFYHIMKRNLHKPEDFRYQNWRKAWGKYVIPRAFVQVFLLQGLVMYIVGSPIFYINVYPTSASVISIIGFLLFLMGYSIEVIADQQLKQHIKQHPRTLIQTGLWNYTRHPNYFGESLLWFGLFLVAFGAGTPWYFIAGPISITLVLYFISSPLMEERLKQKPGWDEYASKTNYFFPGKKG